MVKKYLNKEKRLLKDIFKIIYNFLNNFIIIVY